MKLYEANYHDNPKELFMADNEDLKISVFSRCNTCPAK